MNTKTLGAICARKMQIEYIRTKKDLAKRLKRRQTSEAVKSIINESSILLNDKLSMILTLYIAKAFKGGKRDAESELKDAIRAAAPSPDIVDPLVGRITHRNIGAIGKYNLTLNKALQKEYNTLLSDNRLANSLKCDGWSPWMGETLKKRGIDPKVISLVKQQSTSAKMITIINQQGIRGGLHPDQIGRRLEPFINRYYGPGGVEIDNVGKPVKQLRVDADGNYKWVNHKVTRKYRATTRTYSRLVARNAMKTAHQEAYYQSLQKTNLVDHFISVSVLDSRTCGDCAMMHGRTVLKSEGPQYHGNCHCDLKPVWKEDGLLGYKNRDDSFYINQRDRHFLAVDDLKRYNTYLPTGSKLKHYTMLPRGVRTRVMPGIIKMRAIRNRLLGMPSAIKPKVAKPPAKPIAKPTPIDPDFDEDDWGMTDDEWRAEADSLWAKTSKDGNEHMRLYNGIVKEFSGDKTSVRFSIPGHKYSSLHTHPNWDSPLSPGDMTGFLSIRSEQVCAATSKNAIYIIRKTPKTERITFTAEKARFNSIYNTALKRFTKSVKLKAGKFDQPKIHLEAGKYMAKKYGFEYKVIKRRP